MYLGRLKCKRATTGSREQSSLDLVWWVRFGASLRVGELANLSDTQPWNRQSHSKSKNFSLQRTPVSHKVIEKRRRDRINRCLNELGKTVPMALAKQVTFAVLGTLHCHSPWGPRTLRTQLALGNSPLSGELGASILLAGPLQKTECGPTWVSGWWDTASFLPPFAEFRETGEG